MMSDKIDLKELWSEQQAERPDLDELFERINRFKRKRLGALIKANVLLVLTALFIGFIWFYYQPQMVTTQIGICLIILSITAYLFVYNNMISLLGSTNYNMNSREYLNQMLKLREKQLFLRNTILNVYFVFLTAGLALYMIEYTRHMRLLWMMLAYIGLFLWIGFNWFYMMPKKNENQKNAIDELIDQLEQADAP